MLYMVHMQVNIPASLPKSEADRLKAEEKAYAQKLQQEGRWRHRWRIAGQYAEYTDAQLKAFRAGTRANDPNGMMRGVAARLSDREIQALAQYVAGLR